jgi:N-acylneuraminate cytidylyltransferase
MNLSETLVLIPARGGSKGILNKNVKLLKGRPLIYYTLDAAMEAFGDSASLYVSTDDEQIKKIVEEYGVSVPFMRPDELATDEASSREVILHALSAFDDIHSTVVLLQPTSPLKKPKHIEEAFSLYSESIDMVVSVSKSDANPYYNLFEEDSAGFLFKSKEGDFLRRQDCPDVYEYNGAIYVINANSIRRREMFQFERIRKYEMDKRSSLDIDDMLDWQLAELLLQ